MYSQQQIRGPVARMRTSLGPSFLKNRAKWPSHTIFRELWFGPLGQKQIRTDKQYKSIDQCWMWRDLQQENRTQCLTKLHRCGAANFKHFPSALLEFKV